MPLEMLKSIVTTVVLALALVQALEMAQIRRRVRVFPVGRRQLRRLHRWGGIATLIVTMAVAATCVSGLGYQPYSLRGKAHTAMGALAILVLLLKVAITRRLRRYLRHNTALGIAAGLLILGTFAASALWYFVWAA